MSDIQEEKWINIDEIAAYFGVKTATIRDWIKKYNDFPAQKIGKAWKFKYSELETWVRKQNDNK